MRSLRLPICILCSWLVALPAFAKDKHEAALQAANLHFTVLKDDNNKPVRNASVVLHPVKKDGTQAKGGFQLKTDNEGKTETEGIPYGMLRIQVLAPGFQTFGNDYDIDKPDVDIEIRLKRPTTQYSIYDNPQGGQQNKPATPAAPPPPH